MPHLHLSSLVTKKKIETGVIFFHSTSRLCTYPYLAHLLYIIKCVPHCPVLAAAAPDPTDVAAGKTDAAAGKTDAAAGKTGSPTEHPATAHPTSTTCGQPPHRHHTKRRGAIYDARRPTGRNHRRTQHARDGPPNIHHLRPTIRRHQTKRRGAIYDARRPAGRNHRRMTTRSRRPAQHPRLSMRPTSCRPRAAAGVINGAPTTHRHQDNPAGRNHRRT